MARLLVVASIDEVDRRSVGGGFRQSSFERASPIEERLFWSNHDGGAIDGIHNLAPPVECTITCPSVPNANQCEYVLDAAEISHPDKQNKRYPHWRLFPRPSPADQRLEVPNGNCGSAQRGFSGRQLPPAPSPGCPPLVPRAAMATLGRQLSIRRQLDQNSRKLLRILLRLVFAIAVKCWCDRWLGKLLRIPPGLL